MSESTASRVKFALATVVVVGAVGTVSVAAAAQSNVTPEGPSLTQYSKDQCTGDGWKQFGFFKNEGDCVSYFATGGKNEPSS